MKREEMIGFIVRSLDNMMMRNAVGDEKSEKKGMMPVMQGWIIGYLYDHKEEEIFQRDIEREFDLSRSTVSTILKQLESEGLIERKSVIIDARLKKVVPTPAAEMINEACSKEITHFFYDLASNITDNEMSTFVKVLDTMKKNSERIRNDLSRDIF